MRLKSAIWVAGLCSPLRHRGCLCGGAPARSGEAGAIFIKLNRLDGTAELFAPAPQTAFDDAHPAHRAFSARSR